MFGNILQVYIEIHIYILMYNIILSYVPLHKNRTILLQIGRPHFKDIIDHLKSHELCFSG